MSPALSWRHTLPALPLCREEAENAFLQVCELERAFWDMAYSSTAYE